MSEQVGELTAAEREALLAPCDCGHSINDHGSACWACGDDDRLGDDDVCGVEFENLLCARLGGIVDARAATRLAAMSALADEWIAGDDLSQWGDHTRHICGRELRAALAAPAQTSETDAAT